MIETAEEKIISTYEPTERQLPFHASPVRNKLYGGAMGGGKTRALCEDINSLMLEFPGNRGLLLRKVLQDFKLTTYVTLVEKTLKELIEEGLVKENKSERYFHYWNGSRLYYGGLESTADGSANERKKYFSAEYGVVGIDEAREALEKDFDGLSTRLRHILPDGTYPPYFMLLATNPSQNWVKTRFILNPGNNYAFFPALPKDNPYNPPDYAQQLMDVFKHDPKSLEAYVNGNWDSITSIDDLLGMSDIEPCILKDDQKPFQTAFLGRVTSCDPAYMGDDETTIYDFCGYNVVDSEFYGQKDQMETIGRIMFHAQKNKSTVIAVDPIGSPGLGVKLREVISGANLRIQVLEVDFRHREGIDKDKFFNKRAEAYWTARNLIKERKVQLPNDPKLHGQLCAIKYKFAGGGKYGTIIQIEGKDKIKTRIGGSPDRADGLVIGYLAVPYATVNKRKAWRDEYKSGHNGQGSHMGA